MMGKEAQFILANLSRLMAEKMDEPILHVKVWYNGRTEISVVRSYYRVLHRSHITSPFRDREPDWEYGLGLGLEQ